MVTIENRFSGHYTLLLKCNGVVNNKWLLPKLGEVVAIKIVRFSIDRYEWWITCFMEETASAFHLLY